jgi:hypothetical protein
MGFTLIDDAGNGHFHLRSPTLVPIKTGAERFRRTNPQITRYQHVEHSLFGRFPMFIGVVTGGEVGHVGVHHLCVTLTTG